MVERDKNHPNIIVWSLDNEWVFKTLAQPVGVTWDSEELAVTNKWDFTTLADLTGAWALEVDGRVVAEGSLPRLLTAPGAPRIRHRRRSRAGRRVAAPARRSPSRATSG